MANISECKESYLNLYRISAGTKIEILHTSPESVLARILGLPAPGTELAPGEHFNLSHSELKDFWSPVVTAPDEVLETVEQYKWRLKQALTATIPGGQRIDLPEGTLFEPRVSSRVVAAPEWDPWEDRGKMGDVGK